MARVKVLQECDGVDAGNCLTPCQQEFQKSRLISIGQRHGEPADSDNVEGINKWPCRKVDMIVLAIKDGTVGIEHACQLSGEN